MKLLLDLFPVLLFFGAYKLWGIYTATAVAIGATCAQIAWLAVNKRRIDTMLWVSLGLVVVFGGATLWLHDPLFIKWKPTVFYWSFALILLGSELFFGKNLIAAMMQGNLRLPSPLWRRLNHAWAGFFGLMGGLNLYVAYRFPEAVWVDFKLFGLAGLMIVFVALQGVFLARHLED